MRASPVGPSVAPGPRLKRSVTYGDNTDDDYLNP